MPEAGPDDVAEIVKSALERDSSEWPRFLDQACGADTDLRAEVDSLLSFGQRAPRFIDEPAVHLAADLLVEEETLGPGARIGQYEVSSLIGSGGMGDVYLAEDRTLGRKVALKLVKHGLGTPGILRHFRREERILAGLNHPYIARLYGGGVTSEGLPYFIMEYIEGARLDEYCRIRGLTINDRLELFRKICSAVTYAHQNLVIHRDLKPANIRVTAEGEPKLLDFGIAKLIDPENAQSSGQTLTLQGVMTPEYASPEQVTGANITTVSDVYSLGVVLYNLLTGLSPYRTKTNRADEIARAITEQEPTRPSTAVRDRDSRIESRESANLQFSSHDSRSLRGDLDNIILMAMRKEPARRYTSVSQFSADIGRHLDGLPVIARKDTLGYRASKFVGRNRIVVAATLLVAIAIIAGLVVAVWQGRNARRQRDVAQHERLKAESINKFLQRMLSFSNQSIDSISPVAQKKDVTVNAMLDQIAPQVETEFSDQPEVRGKILLTIGSAYASQGQYEAAERNLRAALETQRAFYGEDNAEVAATSVELGSLFYRQLKLDEAIRVLEKAVAFYRKQENTNSPEFSAVKLAHALDSLGVAKFAAAESAAAKILLRQALQIASSTNLQGSQRYVLASIQTDLGGVLVELGELEKGEALLRESLAEYRQISSQPRWEMGATLTELGVTVLNKNQPEEAEKLLLEGEQIYRQTLGNENLYVHFNLNQQAIALYRTNDLNAAEAKARQSLTVVQTVSPTNKLLWTDPMGTLGDILIKAGDMRAGEGYLRQTLSILQEQATRNHVAVISVEIRLSQSLVAQNRMSDAEKIAVAAYEEARQLLGQRDPWLKKASDNLIKIYQAEGKGEEADRLK